MLIWNVIAFLVILIIYLYGEWKTAGRKPLRVVLWSFLFWQWMNNFVFNFGDWLVIGCNLFFVTLMLVVYSKAAGERKIE